jgi:integrase/recombinase XerD
MAQDESLSLKDVQTILGHQHLSTTADVYLVEDEAQVIRRVSKHLADRRSEPRASSRPLGVGWDEADLEVLFGGTDQ